jgi:pSer/pThr/pTyr-binding forkhead associated (FHA) protein
MILEQISRDRNAGRVIHVVSTTDNVPIRIGRGHDTEIRISDISVSRLHATIRQNRTGFYIDDNDSKFGTLLQIKKPIFLKDADPVTI